jgi:penicillin-binding protein 1A
MMRRTFNLWKHFQLRHYIHNRFLLWCARLVCICIIYIFIVETNFLWLTGYIPGHAALSNPEVAVASELYTADSIPLGKYFRENRTPVPLSQVSPLLIKALICTEDVRFYDHHGFDLLSFFGSVASTVQGDERGGSTITQQLAKNLFRTRAASSQGLLGRIPLIRTFIYKTKEWITAFKLELFYTKDEILEMYLNTVEFGNSWYGVKVASYHYFDERPADLNLQQSALLAGLLKATSAYNPYRNATQSLQRRNVVLSQMRKYKVITAAVADSVMKLDIGLSPPGNDDSEDDNYIRHYAETLLKKWCTEHNLNLYEDGLKIYTTIDSKLQEYAEAAMHEHLSAMQQRFYEFWGKRNPWTDDQGRELPDFLENNIRRTDIYKELKKIYKGNEDSIQAALNKVKPMVVFTWKGPADVMMSSMDSLRYYTQILQGGMMCFDPFEGAIRAYVGGDDFRFFKYDHVTKSKRQPGSTFKTFAYTAAIDKGYSPCDTFIDRPVYIFYNDTETWEPKNTTWTYTYYKKTLRRALAQSVNSITAQLTEKIGWTTVADYARRLGIRSPLAEVPSICLGSSDVNVYELTNAYGTILADGIYREPQILSVIYDSDGNKIAEFKSRERRVLSSETAWLIRYMLLGCIQEPRGTSQALWSFDLFKNGNEVTGKTGTSSNNSDAWYVGMSQNLVTGVWVGTEYRSVHFRGETGQGSRLALPVFGKFLQAALRNKNPHVKTGRFPAPAVKITKQYICNYPDSAEHDSSILFHDAADTILLMQQDTTGKQ